MRPPKLRRVQREQPLELRRGADGGRLEQCAVWVAQVDLQRQTFERLLEFGANGNLGMLQIFADADWRVQQSDARVTQLQAHAAPNASRDERRPPIPAVVVLGFAHEQTARVAVLQVARATVLPFEFAFALPRAGEANPQFVAAKAQAVADQGALRREHIIRLENERAIQPDLRIGVQPIKAQRGSLAELTHRKLEAVKPVGLPNPLHLLLMLREVRVWDYVMRQ